MKRYFIEEAKCGITRGGMACGPVQGNVIAMIKYNDGKEIGWLNIAEVDGIPNWFLTEKDIFDILIEEKFDDDFTDYLEEHSISKFNGLNVGEYCDIFSSIKDAPDNPAVSLLRYAITLVRCSMEELEGLIDLGKGKYADELDIPISDVEKRYLKDNDAEEDDE